MVDIQATQKNVKWSRKKIIVCGLTDYCNQVNERKIKYKFSHTYFLLPKTCQRRKISNRIIKSPLYLSLHAVKRVSQNQGTSRWSFTYPLSKE